jgi:hypothetical protein
MTPPDMARAVCIFSLNLHDMSLTLSTQSTSARLLMHLVEGVYTNCNNQSENIAASSRQLLIRIFDTFVRKFRSITKYRPHPYQQHHICVLKIAFAQVHRCAGGDKRYGGVCEGRRR